jgi:hypothetical protein
MSVVARLTVIASLSIITACSVRPPEHSSEYLDPVTAASVATVDAPTVFARAHQDIASNARQYATMAAVSVDRSGHYEYFLVVYFWSTIDSRLSGADLHPGETLMLLADDRAIRLPRDGRSLNEAGISIRPYAPTHVRGPPRLYHTDSATLQFLAKARHLRLQLEGDEDPRPFEIWVDGRSSLARFSAAAN